jgi:peptide/nickel transport system permease protein
MSQETDTLGALADRRLGRIASNVVDFFDPLWDNAVRKTAVFVLAVFTGISVFRSLLPIPGPYETMRTAGGGYAILASPNGQFLLGTTASGYDVFAQTVMAFQTSLKVGFLSAAVLVVIGLNVGLVAGYYGGWIETVLMGINDLAYGLPFLPFAIVFVAVVGRGTLVLAAVIGLLLWRGVARVVRSETLSIREREFVKSARAAGSSDLKIIYFHILPNLLPIVVVYFVLGSLYGILIEASLSFVGLGDPSTISWGIMLFNAFNSGSFSTAWWWVVPPSLCLWLFIWSLYTVGRALEDNLDAHEVSGLTE